MNKIDKKKEVTTFAPANIALIKYWGKRNTSLNLPVTSSLSVSLNVGTTTSIVESDRDEIILNDKNISPDSIFSKRLLSFMAPYRGIEKLKIQTYSDIPVAAGLASSASGFAALTLAMNQFYGWNKSKKALSVIARKGSGSACRSFWPGFVLWEKGEKTDGSDSHGIPIDVHWPELRIGVVYVSHMPKSISSRDAMIACQKSSPLYSSWPALVEKDLRLAIEAINARDFQKLGAATEHSATKMHQCIRASQPHMNYALPETSHIIQRIQAIRKEGSPLYFTQDAGPNIKVIYLASEFPKIQKHLDIEKLL